MIFHIKHVSDRDGDFSIRQKVNGPDWFFRGRLPTMATEPSRPSPLYAVIREKTMVSGSLGRSKKGHKTACIESAWYVDATSLSNDQNVIKAPLF
jgi:hypothetical protein